jgi:hypothetical protein
MRIKEIEIDGYSFTDVDGLTWHSGKFWMNDKEVKRVYNNGSIALLLYGYQKKSIKKLRKTAVKCKIKIYTEPLPF